MITANSLIKLEQAEYTISASDDQGADDKGLLAEQIRRSDEGYASDDSHPSLENLNPLVGDLHIPYRPINPAINQHYGKLEQPARAPNGKGNIYCKHQDGSYHYRNFNASEYWDGHSGNNLQYTTITGYKYTCFDDGYTFYAYKNQNGLEERVMPHMLGYQDPACTPAVMRKLPGIDVLVRCAKNYPFDR